VPEDSYSITFSFEFRKEGEEVEFCSQPPYSYTKMINLLSELSLSSRTLCKSCLGKRVPYLTFNEQKSPKAIAVAIARQHPGESVGSWMMEGLITRLCQQ
jgi:cytosolic carboxypeptidase protein 2/3